MKVSDFDYELREELIAQFPAENRDDSRLMQVLANGQITHHRFKDIIDYFRKGDCLVLNDTKVIPARLFGSKVQTGGPIEFLLIKRMSQNEWEVILKPGKRAKVGAEFVFSEDLTAEVLEVMENGNRLVRFNFEGIFEEILEKLGHTPLPPYITEELKDKNRYQTVYAKNDGSAAAPTAGLHFTQELLEKIKGKGVEIAFVTLHVGISTFRPVKCQNVEQHQMHHEYYSLPEETADKINRANRVIACGTTTIRTLEAVYKKHRRITADSGQTDIFIYPGHKFMTVDTLITNLHLPKSTLLMLVSAFSGVESVKKAYNQALSMEYRFFSFGDAMLLERVVED